MGVVVVMPTFNEAENVGWVLPRVLEYLGAWRRVVLVVDDSSPDGTAEVAERIGAELGGVRVLRRPGKMGLGSAYKDGFKYALREFPWAEYICEMDADGSHPPEVLPEMVRVAEKGFDMVVGSRYVDGGRWEGGSWLREFISRGANLLARVSTGVKVSDMTSGFRVIRRNALESIVDELNELSSGYVFQVQLLYLIHRRGFRVTEHPFKFRRRLHGYSKLGKSEMPRFAFWCLKTLAGRIVGEA